MRGYGAPAYDESSFTTIPPESEPGREARSELQNGSWPAFLEWLPTLW